MDLVVPGLCTSLRKEVRRAGGVKGLPGMPACHTKAKLIPGETSSTLKSLVAYTTLEKKKKKTFKRILAKWNFVSVSTTGTLLARVDSAHLTVGLVGLYGNIRPKYMTVWGSSCFLDLSRGPSTLATLTEVIEGKRLRSMPHDLEQKGRCLYLRFQPQLDCCGVLSFWGSKFLIVCKVHGIKW